MAITNQQILDFLTANPNMTDAQLVAAMSANNITAAQMASATNVPVSQITSRMTAVNAPITNKQILDFLAANPNITDTQLVAAMNASKITAEQMASAVGVPVSQIKSRMAAVNAPTNTTATTTATANVPAPVVAGAVTNRQIRDYLYANPSINGQQLGDAMKTWGITSIKLAEALGLENNQTVKIGENIYQGVYDIRGSGDSEEIGPLKNMLFYKASESTTPGSAYYQFDPQGKVELIGKSKKVESDFGKFLLGSAALFGGAALAGAGGGTAAGTAAGTATGTAAGTGLGTAAGTGLGTVAGMGTGTGLTAGASGLGLNAAGTAGLGAAGTGAGITAGAGLTGTGVLTGSTLGTGLLGTGAGLAGLTGTGVLSGSTLGTNLLGTTGTGALTGTGVLTGSTLGTQLLGTGAGTAATVGGVTGLTNAANVGLGALGTGITTGLTGLGSGALNTGVNVTGAGTGVVTGVGTGTGVGAGTGAGTGAATGTGTGAGTGTGTGIGTGTGLGGLTAAQLAALLSGGLNTTAGLLQQQTSKEAAERAQAMIDAETAAAKAAAQFRPVGMTTRFGTSQFQVDPVTGRIISAGYTLSPDAKAAQDRLIALAGQGLTQAEQAQQQYAPLQTGAQRLFGLGNQYLAQTPEDVAKNYLNQQMALLQPGRELELANLQNRLQQQGRGGLSVAQGGTLGATTPELQALYNARAQQEAVLAANAQQYGQQNVAFGAGLLGTGAQTMGNYYAGQQAAYQPYTTALGQAQTLEQLGQQPFTMGTQLGQYAAQAGANVGQLGLKGAEQSVALATGRAATTNPYSTLLSGLGSSPAFSQGTAGLLTSGLSGLQSLFSQTGLGSSGFGTGLAYGNQDLMSQFDVNNFGGPQVQQPPMGGSPDTSNPLFAGAGAPPPGSPDTSNPLFAGVGALPSGSTIDLYSNPLFAGVGALPSMGNYTGGGEMAQFDPNKISLGGGMVGTMGGTGAYDPATGRYDLGTAGGGMLPFSGGPSDGPYMPRPGQDYALVQPNPNFLQVSPRPEYGIVQPNPNFLQVSPRPAVMPQQGGSAENMMNMMQPNTRLYI